MAGPDARATNVALIGHRGSGKTTLAEQLLAMGRAVRAAGTIAEGNTLLDHLPEERRRQLSLQMSFGWIEWEDQLVQLWDVPGTSSCRFERSLATALCDVVIVVVDSSEPLAADAADAIRESTRAGKPTLVFLNKMDRPGELSTVMESLTTASDVPVIPVEAVLSEAGDCKAVMDLLSRQVASLDPETRWDNDELNRWVTPPWEQLSEAVALTDDDLLEDYLEYLELDEARVGDGLTGALGRGALVPVLYGCAQVGFGVDRLLDFLTRHAPTALSGRGPAATEYDGTPVRVAPEHTFVAQLVATQLDKDGQPFQVFRVWSGRAPLNKPWSHGDTGESKKVRKVYRLRGPRRAAAKYVGPGALLATWDLCPGRPGDTFTAGERLVVAPPPQPARMMAYALKFEGNPEDVTVRDALVKVLAMDGALDLRVDDTTGDLLLAGAGEPHLEWALTRLAALGVVARGELPPIPYREVPANAVHNVEGVHRLEDGDGLNVEYGSCHVDVEPRPDELIDFEDVFDDAEELPRKFRPAIDEGVRRALLHGPMAGYPVLGASIRLTGGDYDILQSTEDHFRKAGEAAAKAALHQAGTRLMEPWWAVDVYAPSGEIGAVISELSGRRGRVVGLEVLGEETRLCAQVPFRELRTFGPRLESVCSGRGRFFGEPSHYERAPDHLVDEAIAMSPFDRAS